MTRAAIRNFIPWGAPAAMRGVTADSCLQRRHSFVWRIYRVLRVEVGNTIVEFALSSIILLTLVFGVMMICFALYVYNVLGEAAREGSRYAIVRGSACNSFSDCPNVTQAQIQTHIRNIGFPGITSASLTATASWPGGNENPGQQVRVTVTYPFPLTIPFELKRTLNMSSTSQMVISQ